MRDRAASATLQADGDSPRPSRLRRAALSCRRAKGSAHSSRCTAVLASIAMFAVGLLPATAAPSPKSRKLDKPPITLPPPAVATPAPPSDSRPYDGQLIRLSEILGTLSYLGALCQEKDADTWRARMQALLNAEGSPQVRKERLAGAYNRGIQGYSLSYRTCTPNARLVVERLLSEGARIAKDIENRYRAS